MRFRPQWHTRSVDEPDEEHVAALNDYYLWRGARPGFTIIDAWHGRLLLTNRRLVFLSTGSNGILWPRSTHKLDLTALGNRGSLSLRHENIDRTAIGRRIDFATYLFVQAESSWSFMSRYGLDRKRLRAFQEMLEAERRKV